MKNVFFALAFMLVGTFAFASESNLKFDSIEAMGIYTVTIIETDGNGNTTTTTYTYQTSTAEDCFNSAQAVIAAHNR